MFTNRKEAACLLARKLEKVRLFRPVVLGIPRGGVVIAAELAKALGAQLDVVIVKKLRSPWNSELAVGAVAEGGRSYLNELGEELKKSNSGYLKNEIETQTREVEHRVERIRKCCPKADLSGRSVILTDDGIATGATFFVALQVIKAERGLENIVAVPVLPQSTLKRLNKQVDRVVFLESPRGFDAVGQFYESFEEVAFEVVEKLLGSYCSDYMKKTKETN